MRIYPFIKLFNFLCAEDGTPPNFTDLWKHFSGTGKKDEIACIQAGRACVKWTSFFDGQGKDFRNNLLLHQTFS